MLFFPFQNEVAEIHDYNSIVSKYRDVHEDVDNKRKEFESNKDLLDELENFDDMTDDDEIGEPSEYVEGETRISSFVVDFMKKASIIYDGILINIEER